MFTTSALVLKRSDYRDYDRMLTLLSPVYGRMEAVARGAKRPKSPLISATELFCAGEFGFVSTKGGLTLTECTIIDSYYPLRERYDLLIHASYVLVLLLHAALPGERSEALFHLGLEALAHLSYSELPPELVSAMFEMHLMHLLGQAPMASHCARCGIEAGAGMVFDARLGGVLCPKCRGTGPSTPISEGARRILMKAPRAQFKTVELLPERPEWPEAAALMRAFMRQRMDVRSWPRLFGEEEPGY